MVYIFLDIDGVLNTSADWRNKFTINENCLREFAGFCKMIARKDSKIRIVFSSSWRNGLFSDGKTNTALDRLLDIPGLCFYGVTPTSDKTRQEEIEYYIRRNMVDKYIVVDDDKSLFPNDERLNVVFTNSSCGFIMNKSLEKEVRRCLC